MINVCRLPAETTGNLDLRRNLRAAAGTKVCGLDCLRGWSLWENRRWSDLNQKLSALISAIPALKHRCTLRENFWTALIHLWSALKTQTFRAAKYAVLFLQKQCCFSTEQCLFSLKLHWFLSEWKKNIFSLIFNCFQLLLGGINVENTSSERKNTWDLSRC